MGNLIDLFTIVSDPVKIAWVLWIGWGIAQLGWYRRSRQHAAELRTAAAASALPSRSSSVIRQSAVQPKPPERQSWETPDETVRLRPSNRDKKL